MKKKLIFKYSIAVLFFGLIAINLYFSLFKKDNLLSIKSDISSFSKSVSYFATLNLWHSFALNQDWDNAKKLENKISSEDLIVYKQQYDPIYLQKKAQSISQKKEQTVEDWVELSKIYVVLNQHQNAIDALREARRLDPLRTDLEKLEFEIKQ